MGYILEHSEATGVYVENNEQLRKVASVRERCPQLKTLILLSGDAPDDIPGVVTWEQLLERGEEGEDGEEEDRFGQRSSLLSFANTDMAFAGDVLVVGNYHGFNIYRLAGDGVP